MARYLNIDKIVPDEQVIEIRGRRFDISMVPARKTAELIKVGAWANSHEVKGKPDMGYEVYRREMEALIDILGKDQNGEAATFDWVMDNVSASQFQAIVSFVTDSISGNEVADGETPANFTNIPDDQQAFRAVK